MKRLLSVASCAVLVPALVVGLVAQPVAGAQTLPDVTLPDVTLPGSSVSLGDQIAGSSVLPRTGGVPEDAPAVPSGVSVDHVEWHDGGEAAQSRRVDVFVNSAAMPAEPLKVEMLLARDWYTHPEESFASVWKLGGIYGSDESNSWLTQAGVEEWYADKNVNVVMPVGGGATFYTDWVHRDNGQDIRWETFLTSELPGVLARDFRSNNHRAIMGVSMGATASIVLAARHPEMFQFTGSFSGYLDMSSPGMPNAVDTMVRIWGRQTAANMWGPLYSRGWLENDPKLLMGNLRNSTVFVYAGTGLPDGADRASDPATDTVNNAGEALARVSTQAFIAEAGVAGVPVHSVLRNSGSHTWGSWIPVYQGAWPLIAEALGVE